MDCSVIAFILSFAVLFLIILIVFLFLEYRRKISAGKYLWIQTCDAVERKNEMQRALLRIMDECKSPKEEGKEEESFKRIWRIANLPLYHPSIVEIKQNLNMSRPG